jgi:hypothetical protein
MKETVSEAPRTGVRCPNGSHMALCDDSGPYFEGIIRLIEEVDAGRF